MKIVSLLPSATEIVYALGLEAHLEGVTFECDHPEGARSKPVVSRSSLDQEALASPAAIHGAVGEKMEAREPLYRLDRERIREVRPDVILAQDLCRVCAVPSGHVQEALDDLGCSAEVVSLDPSSIEEVIGGIEEVGRVAGAPARARELADALRARVAAVASATSGAPAARTFCLEWQDPPFVAGHWIPGMVELAGGQNLLNGPRQPSRTVEWPEIAAARPDVVVFMPCGFGLEDAIEQARELTPRPELIGARIYAADGSAHFSRPGPRVVDGLEALAWCLHPDLVSPPAPGRVDRVA